MIEIFPIPAFNDNYIWVIVHLESSQAVVVDPGQSSSIIEIFKERKLHLAGILLTHHHQDHIGGVSDLLQYQAVPVYGPTQIHCVTHPLKENDCFRIEAIDTTFTVIETPGHTLDHIIYYAEPALFCGDVLFAAGCGRIFEGTFSQMYGSLQKIASLPENTQLYCAHEYTLANLELAKTVEPNNSHIIDRFNQTSFARQHQKITLPSTLSTERLTNPFLRCHTADLREAANRYSGQIHTNNIDVFTTIRSWKDHFSS